MINRRTFFAGATTALALAAAGCATSTATTPSASPSGAATLATPTIGLTYIPNVQFSPFYVAEADGKFTAAGVKPTLRHHGASEGLFTALAAGEEQFVIAGGDEVLQARSSDLELVAVSAYYRSYPVVIIVPADSGITTLAGLKGRKVGVPGKYGESWFGLQVALQTAGLTPADVTIQEIGYTQQAALTTKKVDAIVGFSNNDAVQFAQAGFATRSLPLAEGVVPLVGICLITTATYAAENPAAVKAVAAGMLAGISAVVADPDHAMTVSATYVPGISAAAAQASAKATLTATIPLWTGSDGTVDGHLDAAQWTEMADFMAAKGLTAARVDPTPAFSNTYLG
ncbi:MAG TPA: ABC transporter substrate-binding protein [Propionicimonas sp.]|uniref:ABC transporter substrate-binding protein n=1 Tax=Propionicimonas sp. TaxID=1955623 RepID=UPI002F4142DF